MVHKNTRFGPSFFSTSGIIVSVVALAVVSAVSIWLIRAQSSLTEKLYRHPFTVSTNVLEADAELVAMHRYMKDVVIARDSEALETAAALVTSAEGRVLIHLETAKREFLGSRDRFEQVIASVIGWREIRAEVIRLSKLERYDEAASITLGEGARYVAHLNNEMSGLVAFARNKASEFLSDSQQQRVRGTTVLVIVVGFVGSVVVVAFLGLHQLVKSTEKNVRERDARYRSIYDSVPVSIWDEDYSAVYRELESLRAEGITDLRQHLGDNPGYVSSLAKRIIVRQVNAAGLEIFGAARETELTSSIGNSFGEGATDVFIESLCALWEKKRIFTSKANYVALDGRNISARISIPMPRTLAEAESVPVVIQDVTEAESADRRISMLAGVFTFANEGICITTPQAEIIEVNDAFVEITGYERNEVIGQNPSILSSGRQSPAFYGELWASLKRDDSWQGEIWNRRKNGELYPQILTISAVKDSEGAILNYVGLFSDITTIKEHEEELRHLAHYDALTSLPNRSLLTDRLKIASANARRSGKLLAIVFIDLDGFKKVNDDYGHDIGDKLLVAVSKRIRENLREADTLSRIGGDEFVAVIGDLAEREDLLPTLNRILGSVAADFELGGSRISISASMGVTFFPQVHSTDGDQLMRQADQAMYDAKRAGRNTCRFFDPEQDSAIAHRFSLIAEVEYALAHEQFELFYQPKLSMETGEVIGAEALLRWNHPERGLVGPMEFLNVIEGDRIEGKVGDWVIRTALLQIRDWRGAGIDMHVSVNIGVNHLQQDDFVDHLQDVMEEFSDIPHDCLEFEILETSALEDFSHAAATIGHVRKLGIEFALDDFGSGYSSLIYLKRLPVQTLKIDQEFVRSMFVDVEDEVILRGVIGLAQNFGIRPLAEGIETIKHARTLLGLGCNYGQGYAISRPLPATQYLEWYQSWDPENDWLNLVHDDLES